MSKTRVNDFLIDDEDRWITEKWRWYASHTGYIQRPSVCSDKKRRPLLLHRLIMGLQFGDDRQVDHINGDRTDNRRENLRICTRQENHYNRHTRRPNKTGYRGVYKTDGCNKWYSMIKTDKDCLYLGQFNSPIEAHIVYIQKIKELHGDFFNENV